MRRHRPLGLKHFLIVLGLFAVTILLFLAVVGFMKRGEKEVDFEADYYFLVEDCAESTAAAVAGKVYGSGGAGLLLEGHDAVVVACYYTMQDAERVQSAMREKGSQTRIVALSAEKFVLEGDAAAFAVRVSSNAETVDACARLLYDAANGLERAQMGQAAARAAARGATDSLAGLRRSNAEGFFDRWNAALAAKERACREISEGLVFAKDLRRMQAELLVALVGLDKYF